MSSVMIVGLHVYLIQKLIKLLEDEGHFVVAVFSSEMVGKNLRTREFDLVLINTDVPPRLKNLVRETVDRYQRDCRIQNAVYDRQGLLQLLNTYRR